MKTAISIPDALFNKAEMYAQRRGMSRSEFFQRAVKAYLENQSLESSEAHLARVNRLQTALASVQNFSAEPRLNREEVHDRKRFR